MQKTILITGSTDGIGLETAKTLYSQGHHVLLHGRNPAKLEAAEKTLSGLSGGGRVESYLADLSRMADVATLGQAISESHSRLDVVINNAGIFRTTDTFTNDGLDIRFAVNTFAPCLLTRRLLPLLGPAARVVNLSSAAQSPVNLEALAGRTRIPDQLNAYAQSKLANLLFTAELDRRAQGAGWDLVAVAAGVNSRIIEMLDDHPGDFRPPKTTRAAKASTASAWSSCCGGSRKDFASWLSSTSDSSSKLFLALRTTCSYSSAFNCCRFLLNISSALRNRWY